MRRWPSLFLIVLFAVAFVLLDGCASAPGESAAVGSGASEACARARSATPLPVEIPLETIRGAAYGKAALITFWATWCDACRAEMPALNRLARNAEAHGGEVIGVAVGESETTVRKFLVENVLDYPQWTDERFGLFDALGGAPRIPRTLVLDRQGRIVFSGATFDRRALAAFRAALLQ